ncbi:MAG: undecaprenyl-diphosphatase [Lentisphaeria bacterium]|jgi:undecaprenyl-diphosphatase
MSILQSVHYCDVRTFAWCLRRKHRETAVRFSRLISHSADGPLYLLGGIALFFAGQAALAKVLALGFIVERICYTILKSYFRRNRPAAVITGYQSEIQPSDTFSFPSGHTSAAFFMSGCLSIAFPWVAWFIYPWACGAGVARVTLGVHFPTDILAGACLGTAVCLLVTG